MADTTTEATIELQPEAAAEKEIVTLANFPANIAVRFVTRNPEQQVTEASINVPSDLTRFGLSEIVNHLLFGEEETDKHIPFEFLIEYKENKKAFLRTTLKKFFVKIQSWPESTITLEYVEAQPAPKCVDTIPHDDWVSAIAYDATTNTLFTGCYDKFVRLLDPNTSDKDKQILATAKHPRSVQNVVCHNSNNQFFFATASKDEFARVWNVKRENNVIKSADLQMILKGHVQSVEDVAINPSGNMICTASADRTLKLWEVDLDNSKTHLFATSEETEPKAKKIRTVQEYNAFGTLGTTTGNKGEGHTLGVTCVHWAQKGVIYSGSNDHTIRQWDVARAELVNTVSGSKVVSTLAYNESLNVVLTGHPDHLIRMWDPRASGRASVFRSHKAWVRDIQWQVSGGHQFVSGGDDNSVKVWDIRSAIPLHSVSHSTETNLHQSGRKNVSPFKVLAVGYGGSDQTIYSGSSDTTLKKHTVK